MADVVETVRETVRRHAMFKPGERVVVGCSGGADSTALLHLLASGLLGLELECTAVYVDHGIRPDTERERSLVAGTAARVGAGFAVRRVDVPGRRRAAGGSLQDVARRLRYEALAEEARRLRAGKVAVGHTRSDQAETFLLQLLRGAGPRGLAAIAPVRGAVVRPLLDLSRAQTEAYCRAHGLEWFDDPSNAGDRYLRNRVRLDLLPRLAAYNPRVEERLAQTAEILRAEDEYLEAKAAAAYRELAGVTPGLAGADGPETALECDALRALPPALARRVVRIALREAGGAWPSFAQVEAVLRLAAATQGSAEFSGVRGVRVVREYGRLLIFRVRPGLRVRSGAAAGSAPAPETAPSSRTSASGTAVPSEPGSGCGIDREPGPGPLALAVPGVTAVPWAGRLIEATLGEAGGEAPGGMAAKADGDAHEEAGGAECAVLDFEALEPPLVVRPRRPGDRLRPLGLGGSKKVKDLLIDAKVPRRERERLPLVCDARGIVWLAGLRIDERAAVTPATRRILRLRVRRTDAPPGDEA